MISHFQSEPTARRTATDLVDFFFFSDHYFDEKQRNDTLIELNTSEALSKKVEQILHGYRQILFD